MTRTEDAVAIEAHALGVAASCDMCSLHEVREQHQRGVIEIQDANLRRLRIDLKRALMWESAFWFSVLLVVIMAATLVVTN
jgi:hypothetical protein